MDYQAVIPEFVVSDIEKSRHFYCDLLGFSVEYERPEEKFLFLSLEDCQLDRKSTRLNSSHPH